MNLTAESINIDVKKRLTQKVFNDELKLTRRIEMVIVILYVIL